jgi:hypothetical protein
MDKTEIENIKIQIDELKARILELENPEVTE